MKTKKLLLALSLLVSSTILFTACTDGLKDPYKDYVSSGLEVKSMDLNDEEFLGVDFLKIAENKVGRITTYESYAKYTPKLGYTESFFKLNDLIVFAVTCCSSDEMEFAEILKNDGKLYPLFYRKDIKPNQTVTTDIITMAYYVEIPKESEYKAGEIIYRYK